jgi:hypothetical protein
LGDRPGALTDLNKALELEPAKKAQIQAAIDSLSASPAPATGTAATPLEPPQEQPAPDARPAAPRKGESIAIDDDAQSAARPSGKSDSASGKSQSTAPEENKGADDAVFIK